MNRVEATFNIPGPNALAEPLSFVAEVSPVSCQAGLARAFVDMACFAQDGPIRRGELPPAGRSVARAADLSSDRLLAALAG